MKVDTYYIYIRMHRICVRTNCTCDLQDVNISMKWDTLPGFSTDYDVLITIDICCFSCLNPLLYASIFCYFQPPPRKQEAKNEFKQLLVDSVDRIKHAAHKLNNSIQTAKPYYEARLYAGQLAREHRVAASNHERARSVHAVAKEMVYLAEQGLGEKSTLDTACQEMLSHAASELDMRRRWTNVTRIYNVLMTFAGRVNESQLEFSETKNSMKLCELKQEVANMRVNKLQSQLKSAIKASRYLFNYSSFAPCRL